MGILGSATGEVKRVAHIDCAKTLPPQRKRLVVCKELLHLLDPDFNRVNNEEDFKKLTDNIGLPPEDQDPTKDGPKTVSDRIGIYKAVAVLFPLAARDVFAPCYRTTRSAWMILPVSLIFLTAMRR